MFKVFNGDCFYQWTRGQKIEVQGSIDKVYITTKALDKAIEKPVYTLDGVNVADVPDGLFEQAYDISVYGIVEGSIKVATLGIIPKERPENYGITKKEDHKWVVLDERFLAMEDITGGVPGGGGESEVFTVNGTMNSTTAPPVIDKTYAEIVAAATEGKRVVAKISVYNGMLYLFGNLAVLDSTVSSARFAVLLPKDIMGNDTPLYVEIDVKSDETVTMTMEEIATATMLGGIANGTY